MNDVSTTPCHQFNSRNYELRKFENVIETSFIAIANFYSQLFF